MKENDNMAQAFEERGAGCYLGYDDPDRRGADAGRHFFAHLLIGRSISGAYTAMPDWSKEDKFYLDEKGEIYNDRPSGKKTLECNPKLIIYPSNSLLCITHPTTLPVQEMTDGNKLIGQMKAANISGVYENMYVGFQLSTYSNMSQAELKAPEYINYDPSTLYWTWEKTLDENDLQPNTTYYYRAYMNDGFSNCYGEIKSFTTKEAEEDISDYVAYAVLNDSTLTFYYDNKKNEKTGTKYEIAESYNWEGNPWRHYINKVIFDSSFAKYTPISTAYWFYLCSELKKIENLQYLNTSKVTDMKFMFRGCESLISLDLSGFNTKNVTDMSYMFGECNSLVSLDVSNFNTANVKNMETMFWGCWSLTTLDLSSFNTANVTNMSQMFSGCSSLVNLDFRNLALSKNVLTHDLFEYCKSLTNIDMRNLVLSKSDHGVFQDLSNLKTLNLSNANTDDVTDMGGMFFGCSSLTSLDLSSFNTTNVTNMGSMFWGCRSLKNLDLSNFNTSNVTKMIDMFWECVSLSSLDLSSFNTSNVTSMAAMFSNCKSLTSLDVSNFNTSNVNNMYGIFAGCSSLTTLDLSSFYTYNVTNMGRMFNGCSSLTSIDLSHFNVAKVEDMEGMFCGCSSITILDLSSFDDIRSPFYVRYPSMFSGCNSLNKIYAGNWQPYNMSTDRNNNMFEGCTNLIGGKGTKIGKNLYGYDNYGNPLYYDCGTNSSAAHIDGGKDWPGLFTAK